MICEQWDIVSVPFPFADSVAVKHRPALVLSAQPFNAGGVSVMAMITSARHSRWASDIDINHAEAGLPQPCVVRLKVFTIDNRFAVHKLGTLAVADREAVTRQLRQALPL